MNTKEVFKKINAKCLKEDTAIVENDGHPLTVSVGISNNLCSVSVSSSVKTKLSNPRKIIEQINDEQNLFRYTFEENVLTLKTAMWVDRKPTSASLSEVIAIAMATINSMRMMMEGCDNG